jgi:HAD superfamily hydrolase (TIGR01509 family)
MNKAFIFDMDGVVVNSEPSWEIVEREKLPHIFGADIVARMPNLVGAGLEAVIESAQGLGAVFNREDAVRAYEEIAREVYARSPLTPGVDELARFLLQNGYKHGLVSQSPHSWIKQVVPRLPFKHELGVVVSLQDSPHLKRKPAPDGYREAFTQLDADAVQSLVLEDSNMGIAAGKASGAFTIGFRGCLIEGYEQTGADAYADTMEEVASIVRTKMKL